MRAFYSDTFVLPLPEGHRFPMRKYARLREEVLAQGIVAPERLHAAEPVAEADLLRCHDRDYVRRVRAGALTAQEQRRIGFPWSPALARRSLCTVGGTLAACRAALDEGTAANLAGGTHHAFFEHGEAYCVFNDAAVAARAMLAEGHAHRVAILDCDVHQGNGTASILRGDRAIFTFSIHGEKNYPVHKEQSDLDIELPDGTTDERYLPLVEEGVRRALAANGPDLAIYLAGADPFERDRLGRMKVSAQGLAERDRIVFDLCRAAGVPVAVVMAGGYAPDIEDIVRIHVQTIRTAAGAS